MRVVDRQVQIGAREGLAAMRRDDNPLLLEPNGSNTGSTLQPATTSYEDRASRLIPGIGQQFVELFQNGLQLLPNFPKDLIVDPTGASQTEHSASTESESFEGPLELHDHGSSLLT